MSKPSKTARTCGKIKGLWMAESGRANRELFRRREGIPRKRFLVVNRGQRNESDAHSKSTIVRRKPLGDEGELEDGNQVCSSSACD